MDKNFYSDFNDKLTEELNIRIKNLFKTNFILIESASCFVNNSNVDKFNSTYITVLNILKSVLQTEPSIKNGFEKEHLDFFIRSVLKCDGNKTLIINDSTPYRNIKNNRNIDSLTTTTWIYPKRVNDNLVMLCKNLHVLFQKYVFIINCYSTIDAKSSHLNDLIRKDTYI